MASLALVEDSKISWRFAPSSSKDQAKDQNFRLRHYSGSKFSAAPLFWIKIFGCAAILDQNFWLRHYSGSKFSAAPLFWTEIFGCAAIFTKIFEQSKMKPHEFKMPRAAYVYIPWSENAKTPMTLPTNQPTHPITHPPYHPSFNYHTTNPTKTRSYMKIVKSSYPGWFLNLFRHFSVFVS